MATKLPTIKDLKPIVAYAKGNIADNCYADEDDLRNGTPSIQLTIGWDDVSGDWSYQTGDNSYSGGAYGYRHWAVVTVYRRSNQTELARELISQLDQLSW